MYDLTELTGTSIRSTFPSHPRLIHL